MFGRSKNQPSGNNSDAQNLDSQAGTPESTPSTPAPDAKKRPSFQVESLEPRIMMSATWADVDTGEAMAQATNEADLFEGSEAADNASGGAGNDLFAGMGGDDNLFGEDGDDTIRGGAGDDLLSGDSGNDRLEGGDGQDRLLGGDGDDVLIGDSVDQEADTVQFEDRSEFLQSTGSSPVAPLGNVGLVAGGADATYTTSDGQLTFSLGEGSSQLYVSEWSSRLDGNEIAISGNENLNIDIDRPVNSFGFDFHEPERDANVNAEFRESTFTMRLMRDGELVDTVTYTVANDQASFVGIHSDQLFDRVEIVETIGANENEFFGQFYLGTDPEVVGDTLVGGAGNDLLVGSSWDDLFDGGDGIDIVRFDGERADYEINMTEDGRLVVTSRATGSQDILIEVEYLEFADQKISQAFDGVAVPQPLLLGSFEGGNAVDQSTSQHQATVHGGATYGSDERGGTAIDLDGSNDYVQFDSPVISDPNEPYSVAVWVKPAEDGYGYVINNGGQTGAASGFYVTKGVWGGEQDVYQIGIANEKHTITFTGGSAEINEWSHLALCYDGDELRVFLNGQDITSTGDITVGAGRVAPMHNLTIGTPGNVPNSYSLQGSIDDPMVFDRPLTAEQVSALFQEQAAFVESVSIDDVEGLRPEITPDSTTSVLNMGDYPMGRVISTATNDQGTTFAIDWANPNAAKIVAFHPDGSHDVIASGLVQPYDLEVGPDGSVYTATNNGQVLKIDPETGSTTVLASVTGHALRSVQVDDTGKVFFLDISSGSVKGINADGSTTSIASGFRTAYDMVIDKNGDFIIADVYSDSANTGSVYRVDMEGHKTLLASGLGGPAGLDVDSRGNVVVAEYDTCRITMIEPNGAVHVIAGSGAPGGAIGETASLTRFSRPHDVEVLSDGRVLIADQMNQRIVVISPEFDSEQTAQRLGHGSVHDDTLEGTSSNDLLVGGAGNDRLSGGAGDDVLLGGAGDDVLEAGSGNDLLSGGVGNDRFDFSGASAGGHYVVQGGDGRDTIDLSAFSKDSISFQDGELTVSLPSGESFVIEHSGVEEIRTSEGRLFSPTGRFAGPGLHQLSMRVGGHHFEGAPIVELKIDGVVYPHQFAVEADALAGEMETITIIDSFGGESPADVQVRFINDRYEPGVGDRNLILDSISVDGRTFQTETDGRALHSGGEHVTGEGIYSSYFVRFNVGDETINGTANADVIEGGSGDDQISGAAGDDVLVGGSGADTISGGEGNDSLFADRADLVVTETFEQGASGWNINTTTQGDSTFTNFLGPFAGTSGNQGVFKSFPMPSGVTEAVVEFDFRQIDSWDNEAFKVFANDAVVVEDRYQHARIDSHPNATFVEQGQHTGVQGWVDQTYRYRLVVPVVNGELKLGFGSTLDQAVGDEGWGIDNLKIFASRATAAEANTLSGDAGNDFLAGGSGADFLAGGTGNDSIWGGQGDDILSGGEGNDSLDGGAGNDVLVSDEGNDRLMGGAGDDSLSGGAGIDTLLGGEGNDTIDGGADADRLEGGVGNDVLLGGDGNDTLLGGVGNDRLDGGYSDDIVDGGEGNDTLIGGFGNDTLTGGAGDDQISGDGGDDTIIAGLGDDTISGGSGNDRITAGEGNDTITAGSGNDDVSAGEGNDSVDAGSGNDTVTGGGGDDTILGGDGNDTLIGDGEVVLVSESFESGTSGWNVSNYDSGSGLTGFLGRFGGTGGAEGVYKDFAVPEGVSEVTIEFDFYQIDSWDNEQFKVFVDGEVVAADRYQHGRVDVHPNATLVSRGYDVGVQGWMDQVYHYKITVPVVDGELRLGFGSTLDQAIADEAWGIDNVKISTTHGAAGGDDRLEGGAGDDTLIAGGGSNVLVGGEGTDTAVYDSPADQLQISRNADGSLRIVDRVTGAEDRLEGIEQLRIEGVTYQVGSGNLLLAAGEDVRVDEGGTTQLVPQAIAINGSDVTYTWTQISGPAAEIRGEVAETIFNADFEQGSLDGAMQYGYNDGVRTIAHDLDSPSGGDAMLITSSEIRHGGGNFGGTVFRVNNAEMEVGKTYRISYWAKSVGDTDGHIWFSNQSGSGDQNALSHNVAITDEWQHFEREVTLEAGKPLLYVWTQEPGYTWALDDLKIEEIDLSQPQVTVPQVNGDATLTFQVTARDASGNVMTDTVSVAVRDVEQSITGTANADTINAADGNDVVNAGAGNDIITGGSGNDIVDGGAGDDVIEGDGLEIGQAVKLDGVDDYVDTGHDFSWSQGDSFSMSATFTPSTVSGNEPIIGKGEGIGTYNEWEYTLMRSGSSVKFVYWNTAGGHAIDLTSPAVIVAGQECDVTVSFDAETKAAKLYVNGQEVAAGQSVGVHQNRATSTKIGMGYVWGNDTLTGSVADVQIHNKALSFAEVTQVHGGGVVGDGLAAHYDFEGSGDEVFADKSGNGHNARVVSNPTLVAGGEIQLSGDDTLRGGDGNDRITGGLGNDILEGGEGNDTLSGGLGNDQLSGGAGNDTLDAGEGNNQLDGGTGNDRLVAGAGNDSLVGGSGDDTLLAGAGNDQLDGGEGNDVLEGGFGNDVLLGGEGNDSLLGGAGDDRLEGGAGNDDLAGGSGNDALLGGQGDDVLQGGFGTDQLSGGEGNDRLVGGYGNDVLDGGAGNDVLLGDGVDKGQAVLLDGIDDYIDTATDFSWSQDQSFSLSATFTPSSVTGNEPIIGKGEGIGTYNEWEYTLMRSGNSVKFVYWNTGGGHAIDLTASNVCVAGQECNATVSFDSQTRTAKLYINGQEVSTAQSVGVHQNRTTSTKIGMGYVWGNDTLTGSIADIQIHNKALSFAEVSQVHQGGVVKGGLAAHYDFEGEGNDAFADKSGNGRDARVVSAPTFTEGGKGSAAGDDVLRAGEGNDVLVGGRGSDTLDGGAGVDKAQFEGAKSDYEIEEHSDGSITVTRLSTGEVDRVTNVEEFEFADGTYAAQDALDIHAPAEITFVSQGPVRADAYAGTVVAELGVIDGDVTSKTVAEDALLARWTFDAGDGLTDVSGNNHNGTAMGNAYESNDSSQGGTLAAVDASSRMYLNNSVDLGQSWTISAQFKGLAGPGSWGTLTRGSEGDHQVIIHPSTGELGTYDNVRGTGFHGTGFFMNKLDSGWHDVTAVGANGSTTFFVDGVQVGVANYQSTSNVTSIGNYLSGTQRFSDELDDVQIHGRALSAAEVQALHAQTTDSFTFALSGPDADHYEIIDEKLVLKAGTVIEPGESDHRVTVMVTDSDGHTIEKSFDIPVVGVSTTSTLEDQAHGIELELPEKFEAAATPVTYRVSDLPSGASLNVGVVQSDGSYVLTAQQFAQVQVNPPADMNGSYELTVSAAAADANGHAISYTHVIAVEVESVGDAVEGIVVPEILPIVDSTADGSVLVRFGVLDADINSREVAADQLLMRLTFDGADAGIDSTGNNHTAIFRAGADVSSDGVHGSTATFSDQADRIELKTSVDLGQEWTISAQFQGLAGPGSWGTLTRGNEGDHQVLVHPTTGELGTYDNVHGSGFHGSGFFMTSLDGDWHDITAVGKGGHTTFFVDGVEVGTANYQSTSNVSAIGNYLSGTQRFADQLDDVQIHGRALSPAEIAQLHEHDQEQFTFAITGGDASKFEMQGNELVLREGASLDLRQSISHTVTVSVTDIDGNTVDRTVTIPVTRSYEVSGSEDQPLDVNLVAPGFPNSPATVTVSVEGLPEGARFDVGTIQPNGTYVMTPEQVEQAKLVLPEDYAGSFQGEVVIHAFDAASGQMLSATQSFVALVEPTADEAFEVSVVGTPGVSESASAGSVVFSLTHVTPQTETPQVGSDALVAEWTFDSGNGAESEGKYRGQVVDGATYANDAEQGGVARFFDQQDRFNLDRSVDLGEEWTISAEFKELAPNGNWRTLTRGNEGDHQILIHPSTGELGTYDNVNGSGFHGSGFFVNNLSGDWHSITAVGKAGATTFYLDGVEVGTADYQSTSNVSTIGNYLSGTQQFSGALDDVRIHGRALSGDEIAMLHRPTVDVQYEIVGGSDNFEIRDGQVVVKAGAPLAFNGAPTTSLTIRATSASGGVVEQTIEVPVSYTIDGGADYVRGTDAANTLDGQAGNDTLVAGAGDDTLIAGAGNDRLEGGEGNDVAVFSGRFQDYEVRREGSNLILRDLRDGAPDGTDRVVSIETLRFSDGDVRVVQEGQGTNNGTGVREIFISNSQGEVVTYTHAGAGNDVLLSNGGKDWLSGGEGDDIIIGTEAGIDWMEGGAGADYIDGGGGHAHALYHSSDAAVKVNLTDNTASGGHAQGDTLVRVTALDGSAHNDVLVGGEGHNWLRGLAGDDRLEGREGDDAYLRGDEGNDFIDGGVGTDTAIYTGNKSDYQVTLNDDGTFTVTDLRGIEGTDTLKSVEFVQFNDGRVSIDEFRPVVQVGTRFGDDLNGSARVDHISGGEGDDLISGGAGNDRLFGESGSDVIRGDAGDDLLDGGEGNDVLVGDGGHALFDGTSGRVVVENSATSLSLGQRESFTIEASFTTNTTSGAQIVLNKENSYEIGINSGRLQYALQGQNGGWVWIDTGYAVTPGQPVNVVLTYDHTDGDVNVYVNGEKTPATLPKGPEVLRVTGDNLEIGSRPSGSYFNGRIDSVRLFTTEVAPESIGQRGVVGGTDRPLVEFQFADANNQTITDGVSGYVARATGGVTFADSATGNDVLIGGAGNDTLIGGAGNDNLDGGIGNDRLSGGSGADVLAGGEGNDLLLGGTGNDQLTGGAGDDILEGGQGADQISGGEGSDTLSYRTSQAAVVVDLAAGTARGGDAEGDTFSSIENVEGSRLADTIVGNSDANRIDAGAGNDRVDAGAGNDVVNAGTGNDQVLAGAGNDTVLGGEGNDQLQGEAGDDVLRGGAGADRLEGGEGADTLVGDDLESVSPFDGLSGRLTLAGSESSLSLGQNESFTLQAKFTLEHTDGAQIVLNKESSYEIGVNSGRLEYAIQGTTEGGWYWIDTGYRVTPGQEVEVSLVYDHTTQKVVVYANGQPTPNPLPTAPAQIQATGYPLQIGARPSGSYLAGEIEEVRIWRAALGSNQIAMGEVASNAPGLAAQVVIDGSGDGATEELTGRYTASIESNRLADDTLEGGAGNDSLSGMAGRDRLVGGTGNDTIDGGRGTDTAVFTGSRSDYVVTQNADGSYSITDNRGIDGTDKLIDVEKLEFADGTISMEEAADAAPIVAIESVRGTEGVAVQLNVAVRDLNGDATTVAWKQVGGPEVSLSGANTTTPSFTAPQGTANYELTFEVSVSDGSHTVTQTVTVPISADNDGPTANNDGEELQKFEDYSYDALAGMAYEPGAAAGVTVTGLYLPGSAVNLLSSVDDELVTSNAHRYFNHSSLGQTGYNYMGGHNWFADHGITASQLRNGIITFSDGTTGVIGTAYDGVNRPNWVESAYIYYRAVDVESSSLLATAEDQPLVFEAAALLNNDTDVESNAGMRVVAVSGAEHGTVSLNAEGKITFTPAANYHGPATFRYTMVDANGAESSATATVIVSSVEDAPVVRVGETQSVSEGARVTLSAAGADGDGDQVSYRWSQVGGPSVGLSGDATASPTFTAPEEAGSYTLTFKVEVSDGDQTVSETVVVNVTADNDGPTANNDGEELQKFEDYSYDALAGMAYEPGAAAGVTVTGLYLPGSAVNLLSSVDDELVTSNAHRYFNHSSLGQTGYNYMGGHNWFADHGITASQLRNGIITFSDGTTGVIGTAYDGVNRPNWVESAYIYYRAVDVESSSLLATAEDQPLVFEAAALLNNDTDVESNAGMRVVAVSGAEHGTVSLNAEGKITFTPAANYHGPATFRYTMVDANGAESSATATIIVSSVEDAPVVRVGETQSVSEGARVTLSAAGADGDGDQVSYRWSQVGGPSVGLTGDATASPTFTAPEAAGSYTLTFKVEVSDGDQIVSETVVVNVTADNDGPIVLGESYRVVEDEPLVISGAELLANDRDVEGTTLRIASVQEASHGTVRILANGSVEFTPEANYSGPAGFSYTVVDEDGATATTTVALHVEGQVDVATLVTSDASGSEDQPIALNITADYGDADGSESMEVIVRGVPAGATLSAGERQDDGSWKLTRDQLTGLTMTPPDDASGSYELTVEVVTTETSVVETIVAGHQQLVDGVYCDSWNSNLVIDEARSFRNDTNEPMTIDVETFNFYARRTGSPVTPFVVAVNGDNQFTVLAVGTSREPGSFAQGENHFAFSDDGKTVVTIQPGQRLAIGFLDARADGTGGEAGSVIPFDNVSGAEIWHSGDPSGTRAAKVVEGQPPIPGGNVLNLSRQYHFNLGFSVLGETSTTSVAETLTVDVEGVADGAEISAEAVVFDGTGRVFASNLTDMPQDALTVQVGFTTTSSNQMSLVSYAAAANDNEFLVFNPSNVAVYVGGATISTGLNMADGQPHELTVSWESSSGQVRVYDHGSLVYDSQTAGTRLGTGHLLRTGGTLMLGQEQDSVGGGFDASQAFQGSISSFRMFQGVLTPDAAETQSDRLITDLRIGANNEVVDAVGHWDFSSVNVTVQDNANFVVLEDRTLTIPMSVRMLDTDGSESLSISLQGVPAGVVVSDGQRVHVSDGQPLDVSDWDLGRMTVRTPNNVADDFDLKLVSTTTETDGDTQMNEHVIHVNVQAVADGASLTGLPPADGGLRFDGTGVVQVPQTDALSGGNGLTVNVAFQTSDASRAGTLVSYAVPGMDNEFILYDTRNLHVYVGGQALATGLNLTDGRPHDLSVSWDKATGAVRVYDHGNQVFDSSASGRFLNAGFAIRSGGSLTLAQEQDSVGGAFDPSQAFVGKMEQVSIWNSVLSSDQVRGTTESPAARFELDTAEGSFAEQLVDQGVVMHGGVSREHTIALDPERSLPLNLSTSMRDVDGSETLKVAIEGLPAGTKVTDGQTTLVVGDQALDVTGMDRASLRIEWANSNAGTVAFTISATTTEHENGASATLREHMVVERRAVDDSLQGTSGNDRMFGFGGNDTLSGGAGNDVLDGGDGDDTLVGGSGNDRLIGGAGIDTAVLTGNRNDYQVMPLAEGGYQVTHKVTLEKTIVTGVEALRFADSTVQLIEGTSAADRFALSGQPTIIATGNGGDRVEVVSGDHTIYGGEGQDTVSYADRTQAVNVDLRSGVVTGDGLTGQLSSIENVVGSQANDTIVGNQFTNVLDGQGGDDTLHAGSLDDLLLGGDGNDSLHGEAGVDTLDGGAGDDRLFADENDIVIGGEGFDRVYFDAAQSGVTLDMGATGIEEVNAGSRFDDRVIGSSGNDRVFARAGNDFVEGGLGDDLLSGQDGNDTLIGGEGRDVLDGGTGDDLLIGGTGANQLIGGSGTDTVSYATSTTAVQVDLSMGRGAHEGVTDALSSIERVVGSPYDDTFRFDRPINGATYEVLAGMGNNTLDLSPYRSSQLSFEAGRVVVKFAEGQSFTINHEGIEQVLTANGKVDNISVASQQLFASPGSVETSGELLRGAWDLDGDALRVDSVTQPDHGKVTFAADGRFTYQPQSGWFGTDRFQFNVTDDAGHYVTRFVEITVPQPILGLDLPASGSGDSASNQSSSSTVTSTTDVSTSSSQTITSSTTASVEKNSDEFLSSALPIETEDAAPSQPAEQVANDLMQLEQMLGAIGADGQQLEEAGVPLDVEQIAGLMATLEQIRPGSLELMSELSTEELAARLGQSPELQEALSGTEGSNDAMLQAIAGTLGGMLMGFVGLRKEKQEDQQRAAKEVSLDRKAKK